MPAVTSTKTGNWSDPTVWSGGVKPTSADDVTILNTHTVTLNDPAAVANSVTVNSGGGLVAATGTTSQLTLQTSVTCSSGGTLTLDVSSNPAVSCTILGNAVRAADNGVVLASGSTWMFKGANRKRWTRTVGAKAAGAATATVDDATGWRPGDIVVLATTQAYNAVPRVDVMTLSGAYVAGSTNLVFTAGLTYDHADRCYIGNFSSNLVIRPATLGDAMYVNAAGTIANTASCSHVLFQGFGDTNVFGHFGLAITNTNAGGWDANIGISDNAFYQFTTTAGALFLRNVNGQITRARNIFYSDASGVVALNTTTSASDVGPDVDVAIFRSNNGIVQSCAGQSLIRPLISGCSGNALILQLLGGVVSGGGIWGSQFAFTGQVFSDTLFDGVAIGTTFAGATVSALYNPGFASIANATLKDCPLQGSLTLCSDNPTWQSLSQSQKIVFANKNLDPTVQETWTPVSATIPTIARDNAVAHDAGGRSLKVNTTTNARSIAIPFQVFAPAGKPVPVTGYINRSAGQPVTVTISGLGIAPVTYNCVGANGVWEQFAVVATNPTATDAMLDVTITVGSGIAGTVNIDSIVSPSPQAIATGEFDFWYLGLPIQTIMTNFVSALDVMNVLLSQLTLPNSVGKAIAEMFRVHGLELGTPLVVTAGSRAAGAGISQQITDVAGTVTVSRQ